jgi:hypothetical protein
VEKASRYSLFAAGPGYPSSSIFPGPAFLEVYGLSLSRMNWRKTIVGKRCRAMEASRR